MAISKTEFDQATKRGEQTRKMGLIALAARFDPVSRSLVVHLANGVTISLPVSMIEGLRDAPDDAIANIKIEGAGNGLYWPDLDVDMLIVPLIAGLTGTEKWLASRLGAKGGAAKSKAKAASSRRNGRLGGRPKKSKAA